MKDSNPNDWFDMAQDWSLVLSYQAAIVGHEEVLHTDPVRKFIERRLDGNRLNSNDAVRAWLSEARNSDDEHGLDAAAALGLASFADDVCATSGMHPVRLVPRSRSDEQPVHFLVHFWPSTNGTPHSRTIPIRGALGELYWLGLWLEDQYDWQPTLARGWALKTGSIPGVLAVRPASADRLTPGTRDNRIVLDISLDLPAARLEEMFRSIQHQRKRRRHPLPARPIAEWNLRAALFAVEHNDGSAWEEVMDMWNASVPDTNWRYEDGLKGANQFAKDARRTYKSLVGKPLIWKRKKAQHRDR